jgi:hypothetical protein
MMRLIKSGGGMAYNVVATATSMGVGLGVGMTILNNFHCSSFYTIYYVLVGCQIGLYIGFAATNKVLDGTVATVNFGSNLITMGLGSGHYMKTLFIATIEAIQFHALVCLGFAFR